MNSKLLIAHLLLRDDHLHLPAKKLFDTAHAGDPNP
jgi:hypothetical protein